MRADRYRFDGSTKCDLDALPTDAGKDRDKKDEILDRYKKNLKELDELQDRLYADRREGIIVVLQALDAAGKDSLIRHVSAGLNPQITHVACFKRPSEEELCHDYLWRVNRELPPRGEIVIFNRSYYEDVITAAVKDLEPTYHMAERVIGQPKDRFIRERMKQVKHYEEYLYENSYRVVKVFLHVSKKEQKKRFLDRIDRPEKNWKFEINDLDDRKLFDDFIRTFNDTIDHTATKESPWYAIPADEKWYARYLFTEILIDVISATNPEYPEFPEEERAHLEACREQLLAEDEEDGKKD